MAQHIQIFVLCEDRKFIVVMNRKERVSALIEEIRKTHKECFHHKVKVSSIQYKGYTVPPKYKLGLVLRDMCEVDVVKEAPSRKASDMSKNDVPLIEVLGIKRNKIKKRKRNSDSLPIKKAKVSEEVRSKPEEAHKKAEETRKKPESSSKAVDGHHKKNKADEKKIIEEDIKKVAAEDPNKNRKLSMDEPKKSASSSEESIFAKDELKKPDYKTNLFRYDVFIVCELHTYMKVNSSIVDLYSYWV